MGHTTLPSEIGNMSINCVSQHLGFSSIWANLLSESNCHLGEARQLSADSHMVSLLGPVDKRSSTGTKRLYKDGIGRSQTDLMLFYRLKCLNLAQEKDYCHSTSRKLALGVVVGKMLAGWRSQVTKRGERVEYI